jgi:tellurite resistance protein
MKLNFKVFKKGKAIYWIIGAVVLFVLFYYIANRGSSSAGSTTVTNSGPSDAAIASGNQLAMAQVAAGAQTNQVNAQVAAAEYIAGIQGQTQMAQLAAGADVAKFTAGLDAQTNAYALQTQQAIAAIGMQTQVDTAQIASNTILGQAGYQRDIAFAGFQTQQNIAQMQTGVSLAQIQANQNMYASYIDAAKLTTLAGVAANVVPVDRDNAFALLAATAYHVPLSYSDAGSGSFVLGAPGVNVTAPQQINYPGF